MTEAAHILNCQCPECWTARKAEEATVTQEAIALAFGKHLNVPIGTRIISGFDKAVEEVAALITQAEARGLQRGIERAAAWHDQQARKIDDTFMEIRRSRPGYDDPLYADAADRHRAHAAAIRALSTQPEGAKP